MCGWAAALAYVVVLLKITVFRHNFLQQPLFSAGVINIFSLSDYIKILQEREYAVFVVLFFGNIAWFIPFGFMLPYMTGRFKRPAAAAAAGFILSFVIEFGQYAFGTGISELGDLLLNTAGTLLGWLAHRLLAGSGKSVKRG
jgi:glycopeptide antibiotics resistance protein